MRRVLRLFTRRRLRFTGITALAVVFAWLAVSLAVAYRLTRRARPPFAEPAPALSRGTVEPVRLPTADGEELGAWFFPGPGAGASVLLLHGNGQCRTTLLPLAEMLTREGHSVLALSLRAHGDSTGERNDIGYSARHDVVAGIAYLEQRQPGRPIIVQGTSLGAAAAIYAAGGLGSRVAGYVLESPYRDLRTAVRNRTASRLPVPLVRVASFGMELVGPLILPELDRMSPLERIGDVPPGVPILLLAGGRDERARLPEVEAMYERVASHARLVVFEGAGHELFCRCAPARYRDEVGRFIRDVSSRLTHHAER